MQSKYGTDPALSFSFSNYLKKKRKADKARMNIETTHYLEVMRRKCNASFNK